ncbi:hypothetical protein DQ04_00901000 [Trypanosoma grayi]|uniref:hypothetical protein n=1 Tax=Trypanosoma grayi TaxID=71804 RepID=UPI0004F42F8B|nr:hypothetical protein DQ04_00901000 [Trypanosoma grayi]KEG13598.1 hypothetical protein DQ04_00901000 [Trypanosoma grayi]
MGLLLLQRVAPAPFAPLQRQLRLGDHTAALPPDGASAPEAAVELMLQAAEQHGIAHIGRPQAEVAASQELMTAFYSGTRHPLTQRQHEAAGAQHRHAESEAARQLLKHEEFLHNAVLKPLLVCIPPMRCETDSNAGTEASARTMEELRWSHFMVRSRALNLHPWCPQQPQMAVVPFLDMLNHTARNPNVTYQYRPGEGVIVVASRPIKGAEELALNYGDYRQRGCLFSSAAEQATTSESIASTMRRIELRQAREWDTAAHADSGDEEDNIEEAPFGHGLQQQKQENEQQHSYKEHQAPSEGGRGEGNENEARTEAVWTWRFGFPRSDDEKAYVASRLWSKGLKRRIAQLTDVRRRGRPGEFVIGVPEGLRHLREQRERLERERFAGATVFPPQNV